MAKDFTNGFYNSTAWKNCRAAYRKKVGGLCEICLANGIYKAGAIVHHRKHLTPEEMQNSEILLCQDNLQLVCRECHERIHDVHRRHRRYDIDELGRVSTAPSAEK